MQVLVFSQLEGEFTYAYFNQIFVSTSKSMVKCNINVDTDFTDYTDFHNHYQSV